jgi:hypothetical protein
MIVKNSIRFNERIIMAVTRDDDFVSQAAGEWRNSAERIIAIIREFLFYSILFLLYFFYDYEEQLINKFHD